MEFTLIILLIVFLIGLIIAYNLGSKFATNKRNQYWQEQLPIHRKDAINRSRAVLGGHFSEQLAPYLPDYPFSPTESKFLGKPIDLIVFKGSDNKEIKEVVFVEIKSGKSKLNAQEKSLKETIEKKRVSWVEYRIPQDLTKKRDLDEDL